MYMYLSIEPDKAFYEIGYDEDYYKNKNKNKISNTYLIIENYPFHLVIKIFIHLKNL